MINVALRRAPAVAVEASVGSDCLDLANRPQDVPFAIAWAHSLPEEQTSLRTIRSRAGLNASTAISWSMPCAVWHTSVSPHPLQQEPDVAYLVSQQLEA